MGRTGIHADHSRTETRLTRLHRIGIFGHVGNGNLGDEAIIAAVVQGVRDRIPNAQLSAFTIRPEDTQARHGIPAFPLRRGVGSPSVAPIRPDIARPGTGRTEAMGPLHAVIHRVPGLRRVLSGVRDSVLWLGGAVREVAFWAERYRHMRRLDLLIVGGSNQLSDYVGGAWGFPYTIYAWSAAARLAGTRVAFLSVGAGPIRSRLSQYFIRKSLGWATFRSYRDVGSRDTIAALGIHGPPRIAPDLAHGLRFETPRGVAAPPASARTVAVNPLPYFDPRFWAENDPAVYAAYVKVIATFTATLLDRGYRVRFVPTQLRADPPVIADLVRALGRRSGEGVPADRLDAAVATFEDLLSVLAEADVVVATRFHGVVLAQMLGKPTIGIAYRRSTTDLLVDVGQGAFAIDIASLTVEGLLERLAALESDPTVRDRLLRRMDAYREALAAQFDQILGVADAAVTTTDIVRTGDIVA